MKRVLVIMLTLILAMVMIAGCGKTAVESADSNTAETAEASDANQDAADDMDAGEATSADRVKIGVSIWGVTDPLGQSVQKFLNYTAEALDCDVEFVGTGFDTEEMIASIENLCASGCDGILFCNASDGVMPKAIKICEENDVYLMQFFKKINDPEVLELLEASDYYLGTTHEDEIITGYNLGSVLGEMGVKNTCIISWNHGDPTAEDRYTGYKQAFEEYGIEIYAEQWEILAAEEAAKAAESFIAAYPDLESIVVTGGCGEPLAGTLSAIENRGKVGEIAVVSTDFIPTLREDLAAGKISAMSGGHWADPFFSFMTVYNVVVGGYHLDGPVEILDDMVYVSSAEDMDNFNKWFMGEVPPFTTEEIQELAFTYNADTTLDDLKAAAAALSLDDVMARHEGMVE